MWKLLRKYLMPEYVSEIDQFLQAFDKTHPGLSDAQRREMEKCRTIAKLRDNTL